MSKHYPEFFMKLNNNDPIIVQFLPLENIIDQSMKFVETENPSQTPVDQPYMN